MDAISIEDFQKSDIRIGTVKKAEVPAWSHWVMKLTVDFGKEIGKKTVFAGIIKYYKPEDIEGKQFPFVVNIEPKKIGPDKELSEAMLMAMDVGEGEDERCILFSLPEKVPNGTIVR